MILKNSIIDYIDMYSSVFMNGCSGFYLQYAIVWGEQWCVSHFYKWMNSFKGEKQLSMYIMCVFACLSSVLGVCVCLKTACGVSPTHTLANASEVFSFSALLLWKMIAWVEADI